ncbi:MAG: Dabb family protein [Verrucomicrobiota bacterium]
MKLLYIPSLVFTFIAGVSVAHADNHEESKFRHAVFFKFKDTATDNDIVRIVDEFVLLKDKIEGITAIEWGFSESVEGLNDEFTHAFLLTFTSKEALEAYVPHPEHKAFVEILKPHLEKVFVFDYTPRD